MMCNFIMYLVHNNNKEISTEQVQVQVESIQVRVESNQVEFRHQIFILNFNLMIKSSLKLQKRLQHKNLYNILHSNHTLRF